MVTRAVDRTLQRVTLVGSHRTVVELDHGVAEPSVIGTTGARPVPPSTPRECGTDGSRRNAHDEQLRRNESNPQ